MWYTTKYETTYLYPTINRGRTAPDPGGIAFVRCLCLASLPDFDFIRSRATRPHYRWPAWLRRPDRAQRDPRLQCFWTGRLAARVVAPASLTNGLHPRRSRTPQRPAASQSARVRPRARDLDPATGRPGQLRAGDHRRARLRRECAPRPQTPENQLEAGQTLDHQPRSAVPAKKKARDRLIAWASLQADWAIGFLDEV